MSIVRCLNQRAIHRLLLNKYLSTSTSSCADEALWESNPDLIVQTDLNGVSTLRMNDPKKLNGWTGPMMMALRGKLSELSRADSTKVVILTGTDPYYCAGVNLSATIRPMHPKKLHNLIRSNNQALFESFLDFPKPILVAVNGPAIGASVTSATLCDEIIASQSATFNVPFAALAIPPEGCSSVHFERCMNLEAATRMLKDGWKPTAKEAVEAGFVSRVVNHDCLLDEAQKQAEEWIENGKQRWLIEKNCLSEYKAVNAKESIELADAFLSKAFLDAQAKFLKSKGKNALPFQVLSSTRFLWSKLL